MGISRVLFTIDSGSDSDAITEYDFERIHRENKSTIKFIDVSPSRRLIPYASDEPLKVLICFQEFIQAEGEDKPWFNPIFEVIEKATSNVLGTKTSSLLEVLALAGNVNIQAKNDQCAVQVFPIQEDESDVDDDDKDWSVELGAIGTNKKRFPTFNVPPVKLQINPDIPPRRVTYNNIPLAMEKTVAETIQNNLEQEIIERVTNEMNKNWISPVLVVPKHDGKLRAVVDLRAPNRAIIREEYFGETVDSILIGLEGSKLFSTIDLTNAYYHVPLSKESRELTNFIFQNEIYRYKRLPFGLNIAPDSFQRCFRGTVLKGLKGVKSFQDDVLVYGSSEEEHDSRLEEVLQRLKEHNACVNTDKCKFKKDTVKFVGLEISHDGYKLEQSKIDEIRDLPQPRNKAEIRSLMGKIAYFDRFIFDRATATSEMSKTLQSEPFEWTPEAENEFSMFVNNIVDQIPKLAYYKDGERFKLAVDASATGLGAVLLQAKTDEKLRIVACASKTLSQTERRYPQVHREALAIVWGVERFRKYLLGVCFEVWTDNEANTVLFSEDKPIGKRNANRLDALRLRLQLFNFTMEKIDGLSNIADLWSRLKNREQIQPATSPGKLWNLTIFDDIETPLTTDEVEEASCLDAEITRIIKILQENHWPPVKPIEITESVYRTYKKVSKELSVFQQLLLQNRKIVIPTTLRKKALMLAHKGHASAASMKRTLRKSVWWPGIDIDVEAHYKTCRTCLLVSASPNPEPLAMRELPSRPWQIAQVDYFEVGKIDLLVVKCTFSRYMWVIEMKQKDSLATNYALREICYMWGRPDAWQCDNGPQFAAAEFISFWRSQGVQVRFSVPANPRMNGMVERQNSSLVRMFQIIEQEKLNWRNVLAEYVREYNMERPHSTTGVTPFKAMTGWEAKGNLPMIRELENPFDAELFRKTDEEAKAKMKQYSDRRSRAKASEVKIGDWVVVMRDRRSYKSQTRYFSEKFLVINRTGARLKLKGESGRVVERSVSQVKIDKTQHVNDNPNDAQDENKEQDSNTVENNDPADVQDLQAKTTTETTATQVETRLQVLRKFFNKHIFFPFQNLRRSSRATRIPEMLRDFVCYNILN